MLHRALASTVTVCTALLAFVGCGDDGQTGGAGGDGAGGSDSQGAGQQGAGTAEGGSSSGGSDVGGSGSGGAPPCSAGTLEEAVRVTNITVEGTPGFEGRALTVQNGSGSYVAWQAADGIHVTPLNAVDERAGADFVVEGTDVFGAAMNGEVLGLLVSRAPDYMTLSRVDGSGATISQTNLVGGGDHAVQGVEWFGEFARTGRLLVQSDGTFVAYHALHRRWPDNVGHQGDTLRLLDASGAALPGGWDWGCSHSMDQRIAYGPGGLTPICIADCYPGKGIYFNHQSAQITEDPAANCAGGYSTSLGGLVSVQGGFFLVFQDAQGASHLGQYDQSGQPVIVRALEVSGDSRLAVFEDGLLLGSTDAGGSRIELLDASGQSSGSIAVVPAALPSQDFESRSNGEVAWATTANGQLQVVRVRSCAD